jgi:hypothetical protein
VRVRAIERRHLDGALSNHLLAAGLIVHERASSPHGRRVRTGLVGAEVPLDCAAPAEPAPIAHGVEPPSSKAKGVGRRRFPHVRVREVRGRSRGEVRGRSRGFGRFVLRLSRRTQRPKATAAMPRCAITAARRRRSHPCALNARPPPLFQALEGAHTTPKKRRHWIQDCPRLVKRTHKHECD